MERVNLPKKTLFIWQIRVVMLTAVLVWLCLRYGGVIPFLKTFAVLIGAVGVLATAVYLPLFFKGYEILFKNEAIIINYGVLIKFSHIMPYTRLIYAQSFSTPLASLFGVTALSLKAARSRVIIPEMQNKDAKHIIDSLTGEVDYEENL
ncbi:MAG: hypothetical protein E7537_04985 [Ruminococcaceae bacterium]|nr:hypothetical protein [Oscillospiraceae bacterium]